MDVVWGIHAETVLPARGAWIAATRDDDWRHFRSWGLRGIDNALGMIETSPSARGLEDLYHRTREWHESKTNPVTRVFRSRRGLSPTLLKDSVKRLYDRLQDRNMLMYRIRQYLDQLDWKRLIVCAELYEEAAKAARLHGSGWAPLTHQHVRNLSWEARISSHWAHGSPPAAVPWWSDRGREEATRLDAWPALAPGIPGMGARSGIDDKRDRPATAHVDAPDNWPPWHAAGVAVPNIRRGLYCHSCAALAAHVIHHNRLALEAGLDDCRIRSIDVVRQPPPHSDRTMSHWWVCVNRPDRIRLSNRTLTFNTLADFDYLDVIGGFVIDMWGVLWEEQKERPAASAKNPAPINVDAVMDWPLDLLDDTTTTIHARQTFY